MSTREQRILGPVDLAHAIWRRRREITAVSVYGYVTIAVVFMIQVCIVRLLGQEHFGIYSMALALVALVEVPLVVRGSELGLRVLGKHASVGDTVAIRGVARQMIWTDFRLYLCAYAGLTATAWILSGTLNLDPWLMTVLALVIPAQTGFGVLKSYFIIFDRVPEIVRYELTYAVLLALLNIAGVTAGGVYGLAASMVLAMLVKSALAYWWTRDYLSAMPEGAPVVSEPVRVEKGRVSVVRNILANGLNQVDVVLVGVLQKPEHVALYKVGKSIASLPIKVGLPTWRYLQPRLLEAVHVGNGRKEKAVVMAGSGVMAATLLVILPVAYWLGEPFLALVYGPEYAAAFVPFMILLVGVWSFHGVNGWFKFWAAIAPSQAFSLGVYGVALLATAVLGVAVGGTSPTTMAYVTAAVLLMATMACYAQLMRRL